MISACNTDTSTDDSVDYSRHSGHWGTEFVFDKKTGLYKPKDMGISLCDINDLFGAVDSTSRQLSLDMAEAAIVDSLMIALEAFTLVEDNKGRKYVPVTEAVNFVANWAEAISERDFEYLTMKRGLCVSKIPDLEEFLESKHYANQKKALRPNVRKALLRVFEEWNDLAEIVFGGATGIGKTYMAALLILYMLCILSSYHNPQLEFGLAPGTSIVFSVQSVSLNLAKKVAFETVGGICRFSEYFQNSFMYDKKVKTELRFPKNIYLFPLSGADTAALGLNIFGGIVDELNFMAMVSNSARAAGTGVESYDQAAAIYNTIITRIRGRFQSKGKIPGKLLLLSSANYPGDFVSKKEDELKAQQHKFATSGDEKDRPNIHLIKMSQWESLPEDRFTGEKFLVEVGNETKSSRIIRCTDDALDEQDVLAVPVEYKNQFIKDIEGSLRDIAGVAVGGKNLFIPYRNKIEDAQLNFETLFPMGQLFAYDSLVLHEVLPDLLNPDFSMLVNRDHLQEILLDANTPFAAHIDLGITGDSAGVAITRISGYKLVPATKVVDPRTGSFVEIRDERLPVMTTHGMLEVMHGGAEVDIDTLTNLIIYLREFINIKYTTMDTFQSRTALQRLRKHGIIVGVLSTDTDPQIYVEARSAFKDDRLLIPRHQKLAWEYRELVRDAEGNVDHEVGKSKDCSDAHACSSFCLLRREANFAAVQSKLVGGTRRTHRMSTGKKIGSKNNSGRLRSRLSSRRA